MVSPHRMFIRLRLEADKFQVQVALHHCTFGSNKCHSPQSWARPRIALASCRRTFGNNAVPLFRASARLSRGPTTAPSRYMPQSAAIRTMLASRPVPTMLYIAPRSNIYLLSASLVGTFCLAYGIFNIYDMSVNKHEGLWWIVPILMNFVSAFMLFVGFVAVYRARNVVKYVRAVPIPERRGTRRLVIEIEARRLFPIFGPGQVVRCAPDEIVLKSRIRDTVDELSTSSNSAIAWGSGGPTGLGKLFYSVRALTSGDGFATLIVKGSSWRMDIGAGKLLDDGQALDRLFGSKE